MSLDAGVRAGQGGTRVGRIGEDDGGSGVTSVTASPPLASTGGTTPNISITATFLNAGTNLTDADATKSPASDGASEYTLPASTLSADRTLTLGVAGTPATLLTVQITRRDTSAHSYIVKDDAGTTLLTFAPSPGGPQAAQFYYTGSHFALLGFFYVRS